MQSLSDFFARIKKTNFKKLLDPDTLQDYVLSHKKQMIYVCGGLVLVLLLLCALIITSPDIKPKKNVPKAQAVPLEDTPVLPEEPGIGDEFRYYREQHKVWSREDAEEWFTPPDGDILKDLEETNNTIISDILEAAP